MTDRTLDFTRAQRLLSPGEFKRVFDHPIRSGDKYLTVLARPNGMPHARLGLAISKKNLKLAVQRNRIKRLVRESFRQHQGQLVGLDLVVMVRAEVKDLDNRQVTESLQRQWQRVVQLCAKSSAN